MCECEKELGSRFLPHQLAYGYEYGTQKKYAVTGFATNICLTCRGEREEAHPMKYFGGKVACYYWREIYKTYLTMVSEWLAEKDISVKHISHFEREFPDEERRMKKEAEMVWRQRHKEEPKYVFAKEPAEAAFLSEVKVPVRHLTAKYVQIQENGKKIGKWTNRVGGLCSVEEVAADWYRAEGFSVRRCETRLVSILVGTFCAPIILGPRESMIDAFNSGFGSQEYYKSKSEEFRELIARLERSKGLQSLFEELLMRSTALRIYLGVNDNEAVELGRIAINIMPQSLILKCIEWGFRFFWGHRAGWPDLFVFNDENYLFVEAKSSNDKLSLDQMNWFRWAVEEVSIPCEIFRLQGDSETEGRKTGPRA
jgi:hypothetical protein